jgi:hypothetical protein
MMRRAATEWLAVEHDPERRLAYCDRWVYDEMGYSREDWLLGRGGGSILLMDWGLASWWT